MKKLTCEMCGSQNLLKQDGVFVCQACGTQYSIEEAKKMMIEGTVEVQGTVDVQGTVKVDNTALVEKYLANARRAFEKTDWEETEKYYNLVEQYSPNNIESLFFSAYARYRKEALKEENPMSRHAYNVLLKSMSVISEYYDVSKEDKEVALRRIANAIDKLRNEPLTATGTTKWSMMASSFYNKIVKAFDEELMQISQKHNDKYVKDLIGSVQKKGGCYVATCVYGSYDCPEVWTLRRYRDDTLGSTWYGRAFIRTYYAISPTLVKWFGKTKWFKKMWKGKLDRMVKKLQDKGVENTPYEDKDWKK